MEITLSSWNKQLLGQTAAEIYAFRKPDAYHGKGIRYKDRQISLKETKKAK